MRRKSFVFEKNKIVVGGDLRSLLYAAFNRIPILYRDPIPPFRFDRLSHHSLPLLGFQEKEVAAREVWEKVSFFLGLSGLLLPVEGVTNLRVVDNQLIMSTEFSKFKYNFQKLIIVDDSQVKGLPAVTKQVPRLNRVVDWINVRSGCRHGVDYLQDPDSNFVRDIFFFPSERSDNTRLKDLVAISYLSDKQLRDFDYSDTMAKFKITKMMKAAGIRGARNGRDQKNPDKYKYYAVKVEPAEREVFPASIRYYEEDDSFDFYYCSIYDILDEAEEMKGYIGKLMRAL